MKILNSFNFTGRKRMLLTFITLTSPLNWIDWKSQLCFVTLRRKKRKHGWKDNLNTRQQICFLIFRFCIYSGNFGLENYEFYVFCNEFLMQFELIGKCLLKPTIICWKLYNVGRFWLYNVAGGGCGAMLITPWPSPFFSPCP